MHFYLNLFTVGQEWHSFHPLDRLPHLHLHLSSLVFGFGLFPFRPGYTKTSLIVRIWIHMYAPVLRVSCVRIKVKTQTRTLLHFRNLAPARAAAKPPPTPPPSGGGGELGVMPPEGGGGGAGGHDAEQGGGPGGGGGAGGAGGGGGAGGAAAGLIGAAGTRAASTSGCSCFSHASLERGQSFMNSVWKR